MSCNRLDRADGADGALTPTRNKRPVLQVYLYAPTQRRQESACVTYLYMVVELCVQASHKCMCACHGCMHGPGSRGMYTEALLQTL
jgi:hypothetical protein